MSLLISQSDYENSLTKGCFLKQKVPSFTFFEENYHIHFLRYLYYICVMSAGEEYPINITLEELKRGFASNKINCKPKISKILIGEAPPPKYSNYFYNTTIPWKSGNPAGMDYCWTKAVKDALYPSTPFTSQIEFLAACAEKGFLLIDLFPYAISYKGKRKTKNYKLAAALGMKQIMSFLDVINCCLHGKIAIAFGLKSFGEIILDDAKTVSLFNIWLAKKNFTLTPPSFITEPRLCSCPLFQSKYLRVCGAVGYFHPLSCLLIQAGIK